MSCSVSPLCSFWVCSSSRDPLLPLPHVGRVPPLLKASQTLCPWGLLQHCKAELSLSPLPPLNYMRFPVSPILYTEPFVSSSRLCAQSCPIFVSTPEMITVSGTLLSGNLQWSRRRAPSALNHVVKGSSAITMQHVQMIATFTCKPVFPVSMSEDAKTGRGGCGGR